MICPCCGAQTETALSEGCDRCGAVAVGPPLAPPDRMLPSFASAAFTAGVGGLSLAALASGVVVTLAEEKSLLTADFWDWTAAAQTAAWRLKFIIAPVAVGIGWWSARTYLKIRRAPARFTGKEMALAGFGSSCAALALVAALVGVTIPARLEKRELARALKNDVALYTFNRAFTQYRIRYGTHVADLKDLAKLPDPDGSIAKLLAEYPRAEYIASAEKASLPAIQAKRLRAPRLRQIGLRDAADDSVGDRISFTNYTLRLPGEDGLLNTEDDSIIRDGITVDAKESSGASEVIALPSPRSARPRRGPAKQ